MRKIVNNELRTLVPQGLSEIQQKLWRFLFNKWRQEDLAQENPLGGSIVAQKCIEHLAKSNPKEFS